MSLVLVVAVVAAVPATREGVARLWCGTVGVGCPERFGLPGELPEGDGQRLRLSPVEAATWGNYVALGDSYSSGHGAGDYESGTGEPGRCWRSGNAYPHHVVGSYDFAGSLGFHACSAQRGAEMLDNADSPDSQLNRIGEHTSLVTLGIGGNDLGFTPVLETCMLRMPLTETEACTDQQDEIDDRMETFRSTLEELVAEVRDRAPNARLLVVGYPRMFPEQPENRYYTLTVEDQEWLNRSVERFNRQTREIVREADERIADRDQVGSVEFVGQYATFDGHEVDSDDAWLNGVMLRDLTNGVDINRSTFHPNAAGQEAFGERVNEQIVDGPERDVYAARETVDDAEPEVLAAEMD
ncbi:SGNH/GDSL hydrolase family protein [Haloactinospora alba]|uniref:SGNH/GDSL hydrolase family protein n=1 Tax=Haloactinospora alba TaxID=405555 RepID=UPI001FEBA109|nr:SGNH/GDSL hydrolase family protein [Haloactinospora alba]